MKKRRFLSVLLSVLMALQGSLTCQAAETEEKDADAAGRITVYSDYSGKTEWNGVLHDGELILMAAEDIGTIAGVSVSVDGSMCTFSRGAYDVKVDTKKPEANISVTMFRMAGEEVILEPYDGAFPLEYVTTRKTDDGEQLFLPLEPMLYLLNVQWGCINGSVYTVAPRETLWNVVGDGVESVRMGDLPRKEDIFGKGISLWGNSFYYAVMSCADELTVASFLPGNDKRYLEKKMKEALLRLSVPCRGGEELEKEALGNSLLDPAELLNSASAVTGGVSSGLDMMKKFFSWMEPLDVDVDLDIPGLEAAGPVLTAVTKSVDIAMTASRYQSWDEEYKGQLEYLSKCEDKANKDLCRTIKKAAGELYQETGGYGGNLTREYLKTAVGVVTDELATGCTVGGKVLAVYNAIIAMADASSPAFAYNLDLADAAALANSLCEMSQFMWLQYARELREAGDGRLTLSQIKDIRHTGFLTMAASAHAWEILTEPVLSDHSGRADGGQRTRTFRNMVRFSESAQYDELLILEKDYGNIYSEGGHPMRSRIPPEYVRFGVPMLFFSNIAEYNGTVYVVGELEEKKSLLAEQGLIPLGVKPAAYDCISSFAFYKGMLYYVCKDAGSSGYRSALYRSRPDGSEPELLSADIEALSKLYIERERLYPESGLEYYDLRTGQWASDNDYTVTGMGSQQYNSEYCFTTYDDGIYQSRYEMGEDGRIQSRKDSRLIIPFQSTYQGTIHAATEDCLYYTMFVGDGNGSLCRYDFDTEAVTVLDSHPLAGGVVDPYFNW